MVNDKEVIHLFLVKDTWNTAESSSTLLATPPSIAPITTKATRRSNSPQLLHYDFSRWDQLLVHFKDLQTTGKSGQTSPTLQTGTDHKEERTCQCHWRKRQICKHLQLINCSMPPIHKLYISLSASRNRPSVGHPTYCNLRQPFCFIMFPHHIQTCRLLAPRDQYTQNTPAACATSLTKH
jgi:hypothetical protein